MISAEVHASDRYRPLLHAFAVLLVVGYFALIAVGGNVTSIAAGLAVPDGWTTFGHFTPLAPLAVWWNDFGTRWEHSHRLVGTVVGLCTIALTVALWLTQRRRPWLRWLGVALLGGVVIQGAMGAARVDLVSTGLALVHGVFGQIVLGASVLIAAATSRTWIRCAADRSDAPQRPGLRLGAALVVGLLLIQLIIGASVRHLDAAHAIPDFPTSYGGWIPPLEQAAIDDAYARLPPDVPARPATVTQVVIHFAHRIFALIVSVAGVWLVAAVPLRLPRRAEVIAPSLTFLGLLLMQVMLGILVVISGGSDPRMPTAHQATGAALLATAVWLAVRVHLVTSRGERGAETEFTPAPLAQATA